MKAGLIAIAALSAVAVAQPHQRHQHAKRAEVVVTETNVQTAYVTAPAVYVDQFGNRVEGPAESTPEPKPAPQPVVEKPAPVVEKPAEKKEQAPPVVQNNNVAPAPAPTTTTKPAPAAQSPAPVVNSPAPVVNSPAPVVNSPAPVVNSPAAVVPSLPAVSLPASSAGDSSSGSGSSSSAYGVTYNAINDDASCRTAAQVKGDINQLSKNYGVIRTYNNGCDVVSKVLGAIGPHGMKLFAGVDNINQVESQLGDIIKAVGSNWGAIHSIAIGNEGVNNGVYSVAQVSAAVKSAKDILSKAGYTGKVVTVDTFIAIINNPDLCKVGDYVAANCHAFFDGSITADKAGAFVVSQAQRVSEKCGGAKVVITESGWPSQGEANGKAVPSKDNQAAAVSSLLKSFSSDLFLFSAFNEGWKKDTANTHNAEKFWGIQGNYPSN